MTLKTKRATGLLSWIGLSDRVNPVETRPRSTREQPLTSARIARLRRMGVKGRQLMDAYKRQVR
ncbi:MAG: hypothetical protein ISQ53_03675 [Synechococcus sp. BS307-5m-G39]|nr:hypothetical protein [Synechococcus sp. BS307-5m-G39]